MLSTIATHMISEKSVDTTDVLRLKLNGQWISVSNATPETTLAAWLRDEQRQVGLKLGCAVGACGACTVVLSEPDGSSPRPVVACLTPLAAVDSHAVTTVEGAGLDGTGAAVQSCMANGHATQCGFCTPGFVMALYAQLRYDPTATPIQLERAVAGNLCRCTGYKPIARAASAAATMAASLTPSTGIDRQDAQPTLPPRTVHLIGQFSSWVAPTTLSDLCHAKAFHGSAAQLVGGASSIAFSSMRAPGLSPAPVFLSTAKVRELTRVVLSERGLECGAGANLLAIKAFTTSAISTLTNAGRVAHTRALSAFESALENYAWGSRQLLGTGTLGGALGSAPSYSSFLPLFCALEAEITIAYATEIEGQSRLKHETIVMQPELVKGGHLHISPASVVVSVLVRFSATSEHVGVFKAKQHARKDDSNLSVAACVSVDERQGKVVSTRAFVGGLSREPAELPLQLLHGRVLNEKSLLSEASTGRSAVLTAVGDKVASLTTGGDTHPGGRVAYRRVLSCAFVLKFLLRICRALGHQDDVSATFLLHGLPCDVPVTGTRLYPDTRETTPKPVGIPLKHLSANSHVAGTALFVADIAVPKDCVHAQLVTSTRAHAHITGLDATPASSVPGFIRLIDGSALGASNHASLEGYGELLAFDGQHGTVTYFGQAIAMVIAESEHAARAAARAVVVYYTDLPAVVTINEACAQGMLYDMTAPPFPPNFGKIEYGDVTNALATSPVVIEDEVSIGSQDHAYMEPWACICTPNGDDDGVSVQCPTQGAAHMQHAVAAALGCGLHLVNIQTKRVGGGFGGKEYQQCNVLAASAVVSRLVGRPVRMVLSRPQDFLSRGGRHAFLAKYRLAATAEGRIAGMELELVANGGAWLTSSVGILANAMLKGFTTYRIPALKAVGAIAQTNYCPSSIFRGAGQPQTAFIMESAVEALCQRIAPRSVPRGLAIRRSNLVVDGDIALFGQVYRDVPVSRCYSELYRQADIEQRLLEIASFNASSRWCKRGLAVVPTVRHVSLGKQWDNQGFCLLNLYTDGTVLIHTGGIEMGQGLHTKIAQVAAAELGISVAEIRIAEVSTDSLPNTSATAGSTGADLNAAAAIDACRVLMARLAPVRKNLGKNATMAQVASEARARRIPLQATGHHSSDVGGFDWQTGRGIHWDGMTPAAVPTESVHDGAAAGAAVTAQGSAVNSTESLIQADLADYFAVGVSCVEVSLDVMTGEHVITRADVLVDAGESLNPALDIGQVEGAFMQGVGYHTTEEIEVGSATSHQCAKPSADSHIALAVGLVRSLRPMKISWLPVGVVHSTSPDVYRVPTMANTPREFNTRLLGDSSNTRRKAVYSSKGVGEVTAFLGSAVHFALLHAVQAAREDAGFFMAFTLDTPATAERVRMACLDGIVQAAARGLEATRPIV